MKGFGDLRKLMKEAQRLQAEIEEKQRELKEMEIEVSAGGGAVSAVVNGHGELKRVKISPEAVDPDDVEMLEDLVVSAIQEAQRKAKERAQEIMGGLAGSLGFPPA